MSCGLVLLVAAVVAGIKLLPFLQNAGGEPQLVGPLAAAAFATVFEVSVLLGTPIGFAWSASSIASSSQGISAIGSATVRRLLRGAFVIGLLWAVVVSTLGGLANVELATPGRVANSLLETGREACSGSNGRKTVTLPILGSRWRCNAGGAPSLVGEFSRANFAVSYSATNMRVNEDMTFAEFEMLTLSSPAVKGRPALRLSVEGAKVRGFWSLARPVKLGKWGRAIFVSFTAALLGLFAVGLVGQVRASRFGARIYGLLIALSAWLTLLFLDDRDSAGSSRYALVPAAGCLTAVVLWLLLFRSTRLRADANKAGCVSYFGSVWF